VNQKAREPAFKNRRVYFRSLVTGEKAEFTIRDQGKGFDFSQVPKASDPESFRDGIGRGLVLIQTFMDHVEFADGGRQVVMTKFKSNTPNKPR
jgi:serine/threonine-protein kinase RsbW